MADIDRIMRQAREAAEPVIDEAKRALAVGKDVASETGAKMRTYGLRAHKDGLRLRESIRAHRGRREQNEVGDYTENAEYLHDAPDAIVFPAQDEHATALALCQDMAASSLAGQPRLRNMVENSNPWSTKYRHAMAALARNDHPGEGASCARLGLDFVAHHFRIGKGKALADVTLDDSELDVAALSETTLTISGGQTAPERFFMRLGGAKLSGPDMAAYMEAMWAETRCQRPAVDAIADLADHPEWLESVRNSVFVVLGAGSSVSPARQLLEWGGHVVAVDFVQVPGMRLLVEAAARCPGRLDVAPPECRDVLVNPVGIAKWIVSFDKPIVLVDTVNRFGPDYLYAAAALDLIERLVCEARPDTALAWYGAPFDAYKLPPDTVQRKHIGPGAAATAVDLYARLRRLPQARVGGVYNGLTDYRGPVFAAVKRIGRWRATVEREAGRVVSYNVLPYTKVAIGMDRTARVLDTGFRRFGYSASTAEMTGSIAAALLVWDLNNPEKVRADEYFMVSKAVDGGLFSLPYEPGSMMLPMRVAGI